MRATLMLLALLSGPACADPRLAGTYNGTIQSAGSNSPGTTILVVSDTGKIDGSYSYQDGATGGSGQLRDCVFENVTLNCVWVDNYGSGSLIVTFDPEFHGFRGAWFDTIQSAIKGNPQGGHLWTGTRTDG